MPREDYSPVTGNHTKNIHFYQGHVYVSDGTYRMLGFGNLDLQIVMAGLFAFCLLCFSITHNSFHL